MKYFRNIDFHPFKRIQIVEDLCKILEEEPTKKAFELIRKSKLTDSDWDAHLYFIQFLAFHLKLLSLSKFDQLSFIQMIEDLEQEKDILSNKDFDIYQNYIDGLLFVDDLNDFLDKELDIYIVYG